MRKSTIEKFKYENKDAYDVLSELSDLLDEYKNASITEFEFDFDESLRGRDATTGNVEVFIDYETTPEEYAFIYNNNKMLALISKMKHLATTKNGYYHEEYDSLVQESSCVYKTAKCKKSLLFRIHWSTDGTIFIIEPDQEEEEVDYTEFVKRMEDL